MELSEQILADLPLATRQQVVEPYLRSSYEYYSAYPAEITPDARRYQKALDRAVPLYLVPGIISVIAGAAVGSYALMIIPSIIITCLFAAWARRTMHSQRRAAFCLENTFRGKRLPTVETVATEDGVRISLQANRKNYASKTFTNDVAALEYQTELLAIADTVYGEYVQRSIEGILQRVMIEQAGGKKPQLSPPGVPDEYVEMAQLLQSQR